MLNDFSYRTGYLTSFVERGFGPVVIDFLRFTGLFAAEDETLEVSQSDRSHAVLSSYHHLDILDDFMTQFNFLSFKSIFPKSIDGFKYCWRDSAFGAIVSFGGSRENSLYNRFEIVLPGEACNAFVQCDQLFNLFAFCVKHDCKCTRLDLAKDDFTGEVFDWWRALDPVSKCRRLSSRSFAPREWYCRIDAHGEPLLDEKTFYLGNREKSSCYVRQYNKKFEQNLTDIEHWQRLEFETHSLSGKVDLADQLFKRLCLNYADLPLIYEELGMKYFRLLVENDKPLDDSHRSSIPSSPSYLKFLQDRFDSSQSLSFAKSLYKQSFERKIEVYQNIISYCLPSLATIGFDSESFVRFILKSLKDIRPEVLDRYGLCSLDIDIFENGHFYVRGVKKPFYDLNQVFFDPVEYRFDDNFDFSSVDIEFLERSIETL